MIKIPSQNQFRQTNQSDKSENIYITKNIDFDSYGYLGLAKRTRALTTSAEMADIAVSTTYPGVSGSAYEGNLGRHWIAGTKSLYYSDVFDLTKWTKDAGTGTPTMEQFGRGGDLLFWKGSLLSCNYSNVYKKSGGTENTWSVVSGFNGKMMCDFSNLNQLAVMGDNEVKTYDESFNEIQSLTFATNYTLTSIAYNNQRLYISGYNSEGNGIVWEWDGSVNEPNTAYETPGAVAVLSLTPYKSGVALMTSRGELMYCQGGLQSLAKLPIYYNSADWWGDTFSFGRNNPVGNRGMVTDGDNIYIAVSSANSNSGVDRNRARWDDSFLGGVWCYVPEVGLTHKYSLGGAKITRTNNIATTGVDIATDVITVAGATVPATGTPCFYISSFGGGSTEIGGIKSGFRYFVIRLSDTTLKLATTKANAIAGTAIDLTGTGNNAQFITFHKNNDFGGVFNNPTMLIPLNYGNRLYGRPYAANFLLGGYVQSGTNTTKITTVLNSIGDYQENRGYVVTPKTLSTGLTDSVKSISIKWNKLENVEDKIIIKYKNKDRLTANSIANTDTALTWVNSTSFTSTNDLSNVQIGDEVEFTSGEGAGYLAHVTDISLNAGTYTVTIDETIQDISANDRAFCIFDNWTKLETIDKDSVDNDLGYRLIRTVDNAKWFQFKTELRGIDVKIEEIIIDNELETPIH
jgi:sporulation protein YlmC with PRC-barrel domain